MSKFGHYAVRAALGLGLGLGVVLGLAACGSNDDPSAEIENESGVLLSLSGIAEFQAGDSDPTVISQSLARVGLFFTNQEKRQSSTPTVTISKARNVPIDSADTTDTRTYTAVQLLPFIEYVNNRLSTIDFKLNQSDAKYGYDYAIRTVGDTPSEIWRASEMLDWCLGLSPSDFAEDFTIVQTYEEPATLAAAESWFISEDERYQSCPSTLRNFLVMSWLGITKDSIIALVQEAVTNDPQNPPTFQEVIEYVLENAVYEDFLNTTDTVQVELVVELSMNEFALLNEPFVFTINVKDFDYSTITSQ